MSGPAENCSYCDYLGQTAAEKVNWVTYPTMHSPECSELKRQCRLQNKEPQVKITNVYGEPEPSMPTEPVYQKDIGWRTETDRVLREKRLAREEQAKMSPEAARAYEQMTFNVPRDMAPQAKFILEELMQEWIIEFVDKNRDYQDESGNLSDELGSAGQWGDLYRKVRKLKKPMWEQRGAGFTFTFEQTDEILRDLIGHSFLALYFLRQESVGDER